MKWYRLLLCLAVVGLLSNIALAGEKKKWRIGFSQCNLGEPWRQQMYADLKREVAKYPDDLELIHKDAQNDTRRQQEHFQEFVNDYEAGNIDVIIISPKESAPFTPPINAAYKAGIPVIVIDRKILNDGYTTFIGGDNRLIGRAAGDWIKNKFNGKGAKAVELKGLTTVVAAQDRNQGFREGIAGSDIEIIFEADMKWLEPEARKEMESALARFDKIDFVYAHNDPGAHGAYVAAKAAGREKDIAFIGIDALPHEGVMYVKQGILDATFEYGTCMPEAIECVMKLKNGQEVPKNITLGTRSFDRDSVNSGGIEIPFIPADQNVM